MRSAKRIEKLPPYLFAEIDTKVAEAKARGADIISFGVGDPDLPTPPHVVEALARAASDPATHRYPSYTGMPAFRESIAAWYERRFGVTLDAGEEIQPLVGSKEGIFHLPVAFVDPGDFALIPDPGYPVYETGTILTGGDLCAMPLAAERGWQPDFASIHINYKPGPRCVELKSLKLYIWSFRDEGHFHEDVTNRILNDLVAALDPKEMTVTGDFGVRGGIKTIVTARHGSRTA